MVEIKYPNWLRKSNQILGLAGGILCLLIAVMFCCECILRYVFRSPTSWGTDYACYIHALAMFMACACTYQNKGHVGVDLVRNWVDKKTDGANNHRAKRAMAVIGYIQTLLFLGIFTYANAKMGLTAMKYNKLSECTYPIPQALIYLIIVLGCIWMIFTVICILLTLFTDSDEFVD